MMFRHIFLNRLKIALHDREMLFWTFMFPLILATFFVMAFSGLSSGGQFQAIPLAVVDSPAYQANESLQQALTSISVIEAEDGSLSGNQDDPLFRLYVIDRDRAEDALTRGALAAYLVVDEGISIFVEGSGIRQTIVTIFVDEYLQTAAAVSDIIATHPEAMAGLPERLSNRVALLTDRPISSADPDNILTMFYALIAMSCLYGGYYGLREVMAIQANQSELAARVNLAPVHKMRIFFYSMAAVLLVHFLSLLVLIAYLGLVHGISLGDRIGLVLLACLTGSITGVSLGAFIGTVSRTSEGLKVAQMTAVSMFSSFLAGLMIVDIRYMVNQAVPLMRWLNPATLISESFYVLYYYESTQRYWLSIALQLAFILVFLSLTAMLIRRRRYASL